MDLSSLNPQQRDAVINSYDSNTVLIAGAGSGKTKTLQTRVGYLIEDMNVDPSSIMVVTFTNKAAGEIKERIGQISSQAHKMWLGTFHSICVRILRQFGSHMGISRFTIMDTYDAKSVLREIMKDRNIPTEKFLVNKFMSQISDCKSNVIRPKDMLDRAQNQSEIQFAHVYQDYQNITWQRRSFDFDDLIVYTIVLLSTNMIVVKWFHDNIKYIHVDESQDTNTAQFRLIKSLAGANNLMLVGDDDQSIYSFRNAKPEYLLNFQETYPDATVFKLEQNYRSTKTIIEAANAVVKNNTVRNDKTMFCNNPKGDPIIYHESKDSYAEAEWVAIEMGLLNAQGVDYSKMAVLYRTNSQSRSIEEGLMKNSVPFKLVGSLGFYDRKEIKDLLSYCRFMSNPNDEISFRRVLGVQKGVGAKSVEDIIEHGQHVIGTNGGNFLQALAVYSPPRRIQNQVTRLTYILNSAPQTPLRFLETVIDQTSYRRDLISEGTVEAKARLENIDELLSIAQEHEIQDPGLSLEDFVNKVSLASNPKDRADQDAATLMTLHSSKGLEFPYVFMVGVEENLLPHRSSVSAKETLEEERRLAYVGISRAKKQLYILNAKERRGYGGEYSHNEPSRFIDEIPKACLMQI